MSVIDFLKNLNIDPDNLSEPPAEFKEFLSGLGGALSASLKGEPCPDCGKVHGSPLAFAIPIGGDSSPQVPAYNESDGLSGEFEYVPKIMRAIQFLPDNVSDVMKFLFDHGITFGYAITRNGESRILLITADQEMSPDDELVYGRWAVTVGSREDDSLSYTVYEDAAFRRAFQSTVKGSTPATSVEDELNLDADKLLGDAEQDALDAYRNGE